MLFSQKLMHIECSRFMTTWFFTHRATAPSTFYEAEDLLTTMPIQKRGKTDEVFRTVNATTLSVVPIATLNYVVVFAAKIYAVRSGTYTLRFVATTSEPITFYVRNGTTGNLDTYTLTGGANTIRTQALAFTQNVEYTLLGIFSNVTTNQSLFIASNYTTTYVSRIKAYQGGQGVQLSQSSSTVVAIGDYKWSARTADFDGWLLCNGREVFRDAYPQLFAIIGTSFGTGNGSTTFNLPDGRGRVPGMIGAGVGLTNRTLGQKVGEEYHTLTTNEVPSHTHTGTTSTTGAHTHGVTDPGHTHTQSTTNDDYNSSGGNPPGFVGDSAGSVTWNNISSSTTGITINSNGNHSHTFTTDSAGGGNAHNVMQPTIFMGNMFICAEV